MAMARSLMQSQTFTWQKPASRPTTFACTLSIDFSKHPGIKSVLNDRGFLNHRKRLLALATQKFVSDLAMDAMHYSKIRSQNAMHKDKKGSSKVCNLLENFPPMM
jgi:hypothetical protein